MAIAGCALWMTSAAHAAEANETIETVDTADLKATAMAGGVTVVADSTDMAQPADPDTQSIVVTGERFRINTLNSRLPDVRDAPQSISIIPREIIEQQAATTLNDVLRNVTGISMAAGEGGGGPAGDNLTLRGFGARNDIFVDGIRDFASYTRDTFNIEQVEVVKGPASAQTGRGSTGGYINLFSKQPQARTFLAGTVGIGAPGYERATVDLNLGGETFGFGGGTALRVNALYHDADTPGRDHVETHRIGIAPSIAVGLGTDTRAILSYFRLQQDNVPDYGIPFIPATTTHPDLIDDRNRPAPVDYDNYYGLLERDFDKTRVNIATFALEHDLNDNIRLSNTLRYGYALRDSVYSSPRLLTANSSEVTPQIQSRDTVDKVLLNQSNIFAKFETGGFRHEAIAGFEVATEKSRNQLRSVTAGSTTDLFDPDPQRPWVGTVVDLPGEVVRAKTDTIAAYLFDTVHFSDQLLATGGIRWERNKSRFTPAPSQITAAVQPIQRNDSYLSWRAGLTYKPIPSLSLYVGAGTSINPSIENLTQTTPNESLGDLKPEKSRTYEIGAKWDGFGGKLLLTTALFRTDKSNARTAEIPGQPAQVLDGKQRVDGFEFGATGRITGRWQVIGSYTYLDSEVLDSRTEAEIGHRLANVPKHSGSLWTLYKLPSGIELGGGARYVSGRFTNITATRRHVGEYWVVDATFGYDFSKAMTVRINLFNLFDERYADLLSGGHFVPGAGRSGVATLSFRM